MSGIARLFLIVHVVMAVLMVGAGYTQPLLLARMKGGGGDRALLSRLSHAITRGFTLPFVIIQPLTGLGLILTTRDLWNPFRAANRWLFASIVMMLAILVLEIFVSGPAQRRMLALAEAGEFDGSDFNKDLALINRIGPIFGILFFAITLLMIWKPGAPNLHI